MVDTKKVKEYCGHAATKIAKTEIPGNSKEDKAARTERTTEVKNQCVEALSISAYAGKTIPTEVTDILSAAASTATREKVVAFLDALVKGTSGSAADVVGAALSKEMTALQDAGAIPMYTFGDPTKDDPFGKPLDYNDKFQGKTDHLKPENVKKVLDFLEKHAAKINKAWAEAAAKGAPTATTKGSNAWLALRRLQAFAAVKNLPSSLQAVVNSKIQPVLPPVAQKCGDGIVQAPEECDDDNTTNGDGCSNVCKNETSTHKAKDFEVSFGWGIGTGAECFKPLDDKASGLISGRCLIPGDADETSHFGFFHGPRLRVMFRVAEWGNTSKSGFWLGGMYVHSFEQKLEAIDLGDSASQQARNDIELQTKGSFDVGRDAGALLAGISLLDDQLTIEAQFGVAQSSYEGTDGTLFTGWPNVTDDGKVPTAKQLTIKPLGVYLGASIGFTPELFGGSEQDHAFAVRLALQIAGFVHSEEQSKVRFNTRTVTMNPDMFMVLFTVDVMYRGFDFIKP